MLPIRTNDTLLHLWVSSFKGVQLQPQSHQCQPDAGSCSSGVITICSGTQVVLRQPLIQHVLAPDIPILCISNATSITIQDGLFTGNAADSVLAVHGQSHITLVRSSFWHNSLKYTAPTSPTWPRGTRVGVGSAVTAMDSSGSITGCNFSGNSAVSGGPNTGVHAGALFLMRSNATISNSNFYNNTAMGGGAVWVADSRVPFHGCVFHGNTATKYDGGGLWITRMADVELNACRFESNAARRSGNGGGVEALATALRAINTTFLNNSAGRNGGGLHMLNSSALLVNLVFSNNTAGSQGGGLQLEGVPKPEVVMSGVWHMYDMREIQPFNVTAMNCLWLRNHAGSGGGLGLLSANITCRSCVFDANSAAFHRSASVLLQVGEMTSTNSSYMPDSYWVESASFINLQWDAAARGSVRPACGSTMPCKLLSVSQVATCAADDGTQVAYHYGGHELVNPCQHSNWQTHVIVVYTVCLAGALGVAGWAVAKVLLRRKPKQRQHCRQCRQLKVLSSRLLDRWWVRVVLGLLRAALLIVNIITDVLVMVQLSAFLGQRQTEHWPPAKAGGGRSYGGALWRVSGNHQQPWLLPSYLAVFALPHVAASLLLHIRVMLLLKQHQPSVLMHAYHSLIGYLILFAFCHRQSHGALQGLQWVAVFCCSLIVPWLLLFSWFNLLVLLLHGVSAGHLFSWMDGSNFYNLHSFLVALLQSPYSAALVTYVYATQVSAELPVEVDDRLFYLSVGSSMLHLLYVLGRLVLAAADGQLRALVVGLCWETVKLDDSALMTATDSEAPGVPAAAAAATTPKTAVAAAVGVQGVRALSAPSLRSPAIAAAAADVCPAANDNRSYHLCKRVMCDSSSGPPAAPSVG
jgi:hypothetical protein